MVTDAHLAALAIEHGCVLVTRDSDFARFESALASSAGGGLVSAYPRSWRYPRHL